jgi:hypothetical protein
LNFYDFNVTSLKGTLYYGPDSLGEGTVIQTPSLNNITVNSPFNGPVRTQQPTTPTIDSCSDTFAIQTLLMTCSAWNADGDGCLVNFSCYKADGTVDNESCTASPPSTRISTSITWQRCTFTNMNDCVAVLVDMDPASLYPSEADVLQPQQLLITNVTLPG